MSKIHEAKEILKTFGLPPRQQNDRSARVLLAMLDLKEGDSWKKATNKLIGIHEMITNIAEEYGYQYAENSRESIRRQTIHQFVQAGLVVRNADDPSRPTNSGRTVYSITPEALEVIKTYHTHKWNAAVTKFMSELNSLIKKYENIQKKHLISIKIGNKDFAFSPGKHNKLQKDILDQFAPRFAGKSIVVYVGDTAYKQLYLDNELCENLRIDIVHHDKLPDVVLSL
ncbi:MAG: restriction endonuclease [Calditrichaeota bacterium]|nr:restriction endonuclease [Calditrichota bacterium]